MQKQFAIGNLGQDPELRTIKDSDRQVATFTIASNDRRGGKKVTTWFKVNSYGNSAKACAENLRKGDPVYVEGPLKAEPYIRKADGEAAVTLTIDATNVTFLPKNRASSAPAEPTSAASPNDGGDIVDDDIPF